MVLVHEIDVREVRKARGLVVALEAPLFLRLALPLDGIEVAVLAGHVPGPHEILVVELGLAELDLPFRGHVADPAAADGVLDAPELGSLEVAQEAGRLGNLHVVPYNDLTVAAGATQLLAALEVGEVGLVVELDLDGLFPGRPGRRERHLPLQEPGLVAPLPQARFVADLRVRLGAVGPSDVLDDLGQRLELQHHLVLDVRRVMAVDARDVVVLRGLPGVVVRFHDVAAGAEVRARRELEHPDGEDQDENSEEPQELEELGLDVEPVVLPLGDVHPHGFHDLPPHAPSGLFGRFLILLLLVHRGAFLSQESFLRTSCEMGILTGAKAGIQSFFPSFPSPGGGALGRRAILTASRAAMRRSIVTA